MKDYTVSVEELSHLDFIGIECLLARDDDHDAVTEMMTFWEENINDGTVARLQALCRTDAVYGIFSNKNIAGLNQASYHIAGRCAFDTDADGFQKMHIYPARYAVLSADCKAPTTLAQAYERLHILFLHEWLPGTGYSSLMDTRDDMEGTASLVLFSPLKMNAEEFQMTILFPLGNA